MGYKAKYRPTLHIDLGYMGDNNGVPFFADIKNPRLLTFDEKLELGEISNVADKEEKKGAMKELVRKLVINSNLLDKETEAPIDFNDIDIWKHLPGEVAETIMKEFAPAKKDEEEIKNS